MPKSNVNVKATFESETSTEPVEEKDEYEIKITNTAGGSVSADKTSAKPGDTVTLTAEPDDGYELNTLYVLPTSGNLVVGLNDDNSFTMPKSDVKVEGYFTKLQYSINFESNTEHGKIETSAEDNKTRWGNDVNIFLVPDTGYKVASYTLTDKDGNSISVDENNIKEIEATDENENPITVTSITIEMPLGGVNVTALFVEQSPVGTAIIDTLPTTAGTYYLTKDISISNTWEVPSGDTVLDLNGYGILKTGSTSVISVGRGSNLTINDSDTSRTHAITLTSYRGTAVTDGSGDTSVSSGNGTIYISGGYITGGVATNFRGGAITFSTSGDGTVTMTGGTLVGNRAGWGGAVFVAGSSTFTMQGTASLEYNYGDNTQYASGGAAFVQDSATFNINGGTIRNNYCEHDAGAVDVAGTTTTLNISGGVITDNISASTYGGGVKIQSAATVNISGSPIIKNNTASGSTSNFHLNEATRLNLDGIEESASIGIHLNAAGVFTSTTDTSYNRTSNFTSDKEGFTVSKNDNGQLELVAQ